MNNFLNRLNRPETPPEGLGGVLCRLGLEMMGFCAGYAAVLALTHFLPICGLLLDTLTIFACGMASALFTGKYSWPHLSMTHRLDCVARMSPIICFLHHGLTLDAWALSLIFPAALLLWQVILLYLPYVTDREAFLALESRFIRLVVLNDMRRCMLGDLLSGSPDDDDEND